MFYLLPKQDGVLNKSKYFIFEIKLIDNINIFKKDVLLITYYFKKKQIFYFFSSFI